MDTATLTLVKEKKMFTNLFRKRAELENMIAEGMDIVLSVIEIMEKETADNDPFIMANRILDLETLFENHEKKIISMIDRKHFLPVCWEELLKINNSTRQLLNQFVMVFNKIQIFRSSESFSAFYEHEKRFLLNVKNFLFEYSGNRKYVYQLMLNNQHELKDFMKIYFTRLNAIFGERIEDSDTRMKMLELFEQINETNEEIQGAVSKIYIGTSI